MLLVDDLAAGGTKNLRHTPRGLVTLVYLSFDLGVFFIANPRSRLVPHVDKAPLPLRILRLVTSNFLTSRESHSSDCACSRKSICLHPGSISHFKMRNEHVLKTEKICRTFFSIRSLSNIAVIGNFDFNNFFNVLRF